MNWLKCEIVYNPCYLLTAVFQFRRSQHFRHRKTWEILILLVSAVNRVTCLLASCLHCSHPKLTYSEVSYTQAFESTTKLRSVWIRSSTDKWLRIRPFSKSGILRWSAPRGIPLCCDMYSCSFVVAFEKWSFERGGKTRISIWMNGSLRVLLSRLSLVGLLYVHTHLSSRKARLGSK